MSMMGSPPKGPYIVLSRAIVVRRPNASAQKRAIASRLTFETGLEGAHGVEALPRSPSSSSSLYGSACGE